MSLLLTAQGHRALHVGAWHHRQHHQYISYTPSAALVSRAQAFAVMIVRTRSAPKRSRGCLAPHCTGRLLSHGRQAEECPEQARNAALWHLNFQAVGGPNSYHQHHWHCCGCVFEEAGLQTVASPRPHLHPSQQSRSRHPCWAQPHQIALLQRVPLETGPCR